MRCRLVGWHALRYSEGRAGAGVRPRRCDGDRPTFRALLHALRSPSGRATRPAPWSGLCAETPKRNTASAADANGSTAIRETHEKKERNLLNFAVRLLTVSQ